MPLLVAIMRTGERSLSRARFKKEKHSMSSICTSSINNTYNQKEKRLTETHEKQTGAYKNTHPWNDLRLSFFPPLTHFGINLLADFRLDLSGVSREKSQEALCATVNDVDLVQRHCVDHLFSLLQLSLRTLYKLCLKRR